MDESAFETLADDTLADLVETIEESLGDVLDADLQEGILTIELDGGGEYVINKHLAMRQLWVSSPASGATHFIFDGDVWVSTRDAKTILGALLAGELSAATGRPFSLD